MTPRWYEKAVEELEQELLEGNITNEEFRTEMRNLNWELEDEARAAADAAYDDIMGGD